MRRLSKPVRFALGVLLAAALALSPGIAFAGIGSAHQDAVMTTDTGAPCDMPCDDCGDGKSSAACALACSGLIASIPAPAFAALPTVPAAHAEAILAILFAGREREPDKPPPRPVLA
ncbi:MAG: hypothetical protein JNK07_02090 [Alphaproteobacteria bacterium]|nr:hypothetical protein [Alphaproteobacteria bacterium]